MVFVVTLYIPPVATHVSLMYVRVRLKHTICHGSARVLLNLYCNSVPLYVPLNIVPFHVLFTSVPFTMTPSRKVSLWQNTRIPEPSSLLYVRTVHRPFSSDVFVVELRFRLKISALPQCG